MNELDLPQLCARCRKLKAATLGRLFWSKHKYNRRVFVCSECLGKPKVHRLARKPQETPIECEAREALERLNVEAYAEYSMSKFIFDFAVPRLRLLIEVDSETFHGSWGSAKRDKSKDDWARRNHWHLVRIRAPDIAQQIVHAVASRRRGLS